MSDVIREQIRAARPAAAEQVPAALRASVLAGAYAGASRDAPVPARRPWRIRHALPLVIAALIGVGGVATGAGLVVSNATKQQATALRHQLPVDPGGPGLRGAALVQELERLRSITPFPPGVHDVFPARALEGTATGSVRITVEERAGCLWQRYWLSSTVGGDTAGAAAALRILHQIPYWPSSTSAYRGNRRVSAVNVARQAETGDVAAFAQQMTRGCQGLFGQR